MFFHFFFTFSPFHGVSHPALSESQTSLLISSKLAELAQKEEGERENERIILYTFYQEEEEAKF